MSELQDPSASTSSTPSTSNGRSPLKRTASESLDPSERLTKRPRDSDQHRDDNHTPPTSIDEDGLNMIDEELKAFSSGHLSVMPVDEIPKDKARAAVNYLEDMEEELRCGCCTELLYNPVTVSPCGHYFCGSCCVLWVRNGGTSCPACRQSSTSVNHSKILQAFIDVLLRSHPDKQRPEEERRQADEVYLPSMLISIPPPKPVNPEGSLMPQSRSHDPPADNLARPCPHCIPNNEFGWRCPSPLADPETDPANAWNLDDGNPPGHAWCGYCDELHATGAPSTTRCSICATSYCGLSVPHMCMASSFHSAHLPTSLESLHGFIQSSEIYEAFNGNTVEVEALLDWLREDGRGPRGILLDVIEFVRSTPSGFRGLLDEGIFSKAQNEGEDAQDSDDEGSSSLPNSAPLHLVPEGSHTNNSTNMLNLPGSSQPNNAPAPVANIPGMPPPPSVPGSVLAPPPPPPPPPPPLPFTRTCRDCAHDIFSWGLYEWWGRERHSIIQHARAEHNLDGLSGRSSSSSTQTPTESEEPTPPTAMHGLPAWMMAPTRVDCQNGRNCMNQHDIEHAKQFNHVIATTIPVDASTHSPIEQINSTGHPPHVNPGPTITRSRSFSHGQLASTTLDSAPFPAPPRVFSFTNVTNGTQPPLAVPLETFMTGGRIFMTQSDQGAFPVHTNQHSNNLLMNGSAIASGDVDIIMQPEAFTGSLSTPFTVRAGNPEGSRSSMVAPPTSLPAAELPVSFRNHNITGSDTRVEEIDCISVEQALELQDHGSSSAISMSDTEPSPAKNSFSQSTSEVPAQGQVQTHILPGPSGQTSNPSRMTSVVIA